MAHSFSAVYIHLVFSTKDRRPFLTDQNLRQDLHRYLAGIASNQNLPATIVGGVEDHVHLLLKQGREAPCQSNFVRDLKRSSTKWIKDVAPYLSDFNWQSGYAVLSVSHREVETVGRYIANQVEHHRAHNFQDEYRRLLIEHGIDLDEKYMWE
ncbi:MAG: IS200/IS605 family transposase [Fimbriimonas sp.]